MKKLLVIASFLTFGSVAAVNAQSSKPESAAKTEISSDKKADKKSEKSCCSKGNKSSASCGEKGEKSSAKSCCSKGHGEMKAETPAEEQKKN
jgi:hypothetical protein